MQDKTDYFSLLPTVIKAKITEFVPTKEFIHLSMTSKYNHNLFSTNKYLAPQKATRTFLHHVVRGNHEAVAKMLKNNLDLMHTKGPVTDSSDRIFTNISGFEYCLWALDKHMWTNMLDCLPKTKEAEKIKEILRAQYQNIKEVGVTYERNGVSTQTPEKHFDFEGTIILQLDIQVKCGGLKEWKVGVGGAQKLLPLHAVYLYCGNTRFYPLHDFKEQPTSSKEFYNVFNKNKKESWFCEGSKLGIDFAICKGGENTAWACSFRYKAGYPAIDLEAIQAWYKIRKKDFLALEEDLKPCNLLEEDLKPCNLLEEDLKPCNLTENQHENWCILY